MKPPLPPLSARFWHARAAEQASVRSILLPTICFVLGLALSALWLQRPARPAPSRQPAPELSGSTRDLLGGLTQPVEVRFYSLIDPAAPTSLTAFAQRAEQLLLAYEQQANGKIVLTRLDSLANANPNTALADGIKGFDLDKGEGSYLGVSFSCAGKKTVLPQLSPEWEPALEADISRAIQQVTQAGSITKVTSGATPADKAVLEEIRQRIPNLDSVPLEEGIRALREDSVKEFAAAAGEMQAKVQDAQAQLLQAKKGGSRSEQDAAMKNLQAVQTAQAQRLKEIAANAQARIETFQRLKSKSTAK